MSVFAAELELLLKQTFFISEDAECRVWHRYMTHTYEFLNNSSQTLQDAGLYNRQVCIQYIHLNWSYLSSLLLHVVVDYCFGIEEGKWNMASQHSVSSKNSSFLNKVFHGGWAWW